MNENFKFELMVSVLIISIIFLFIDIIFKMIIYNRLRKKYDRLCDDYSKIIAIMRNEELTEKGKITEIEWEIDRIPF